MDHNDVSPFRPVRRLLTPPETLDRLLAMMARWWDGASLRRIGRESGVSRQRVATILASVGCTGSATDRSNHNRADSRHRALARHVAVARQALLHRLARRLTVRQRAALAWQALGLAAIDIARRMQTTPQNVRHFRIAALWRLERLSRPKRRRAQKRSSENAELGPLLLESVEIPTLDWSGLTADLSADNSRPNH